MHDHNDGDFQRPAAGNLVIIQSLEIFWIPYCLLPLRCASMKLPELDLHAMQVCQHM